jgi:hypothetical protein
VKDTFLWQVLDISPSVANAIPPPCTGEAKVGVGYSDDERYIVDLVERVVQVSVRTVDIVQQIARLPLNKS